MMLSPAPAGKSPCALCIATKMLACLVIFSALKSSEGSVRGVSPSQNPETPAERNNNAEEQHSQHHHLRMDNEAKARTIDFSFKADGTACKPGHCPKDLLAQTASDLYDDIKDQSERNLLNRHYLHLRARTPITDEPTEEDAIVERRSLFESSSSGESDNDNSAPHERDGELNNNNSVHTMKIEKEPLVSFASAMMFFICACVFAVLSIGLRFGLHRSVMSAFLRNARSVGGGRGGGKKDDPAPPQSPRSKANGSKSPRKNKPGTPRRRNNKGSSSWPNAGSLEEGSGSGSAANSPRNGGSKPGSPRGAGGGVGGSKPVSPRRRAVLHRADSSGGLMQMQFQDVPKFAQMAGYSVDAMLSAVSSQLH